MEPSPEDPDSDDSNTSSNYSGYSVTLPEREPQVDSAPGSTTQAPSEVRSDPEDFCDAQVEVKLYTLGGFEYIVWLNNGANVGHLVQKLLPQLPPRHRDLTFCSTVVGDGAFPRVHSCTAEYTRVLCGMHFAHLIATRKPFCLQLVWRTAPSDYEKYELRDRSRTPTS